MIFNLVRMRTSLPGTLLLAFAILGGFPAAHAQLRFGNPRNDSTAVFAIAPREATRPLKIAEKAIKDRDFRQATELLGDLLSESMLNEYLIPDKARKGHAISLRKKAEQLLGQIPLAQRQSYQEKYGIKAKVMLQKAIEANDTQAIAMTSRLYFHTRAGLEATMLVGHDHLAQGRPAMAAVAFEKVAANPQGSARFDPEASLLAAVSWSLNGSTGRSDELLRALKKKNGDAEISFYGRKFPVFEHNSVTSKDSVAPNQNPLPLPAPGATVANPASTFNRNTPLQKWLKEIVGSTPLESHPIVNQWLVYRGDARRNAESGSGFPLLSPRWSIRTIAEPADEAGILEFQQKLIQAKVSPMPKVHPLAIGNTLVIRTEDRMFGVNADNGKRIWSYPPANVFRSGAQKAADALDRPSGKLHQNKLRERLWLDALYGQISSDGNSIFLIPNPGISTDRENWRSYQTQVYDEPTDLRLYNELKSLDIKQQGALQWQVGGETGLDEPELAKTFFLGAPLPIKDRLYAICVQEQSVKLVVLDSETGRLQWARHLASTEESVSFREDRLRRLAGATPSEANGILVCPTGLNAIVAVDLATQALSWGYQFKHPQRARRSNPLTDSLSKWDTMWRDASVTLINGAVVYTPIDSDEIYCLNLQTGDFLWADRKRKSSRHGYKSMHVETVRDGNIIITSSDRLKAIELATGAVLWETRLDDFELVSGRGYVSGNHCFIPTTSKRVLRINTATGEIDGAAATEKVLGNLISFRGDVISHGADHLTAYPRDEPSRLMLAEGAETPLEDHARLSIQAQLHLLDGQYAQSVDAISRAYDLFPNSNYANLLVQALTRLIDVDFATAEQVSNRYQNLFKKQDLHRLLRGKVTGLMKLQRVEEAFEALMKIAETIELESTADKSAAQSIEDDNRVVLPAVSVDLAESMARNSANAELTFKLPQWLRWKLHEVYQACDGPTRETYRRSVAAHLASFESSPLNLRHDRISLFPVDAVSENVRLKTAAGLLAAGQYARAHSLMMPTPTGASSSSTETSDGILSEAESLLTTMTDGGFRRDTVSTLEETIENLRTVQSAQRSILDADLYQLGSRDSHDGQILRNEPLEVDWSHDVTRLEQEKLSNFFTSTQHFCEIVSTDQPALNRLSFRYSDEFREFQMYDSLGRFVHKIYLDPDGNLQGTKQGSKGRVFLNKSLMLLCIDKEMFAIDWERFIRGKSALLWYADNVVASSSGLSGNTNHGISVFSDGKLMSLHPFTGETLWQRSQVSSRAALLEGAESITIWSRSQPRTFDKVDPLAGRLLACGKMERQLRFASATSRDLQLFRTSIEAKENQQDDRDAEVERMFDSQRRKYASEELNLFDFNQQKVLWTKNLPYPVKTALVDQDSLLVFSGDGLFSMIDVRSGEVKFETSVPELTKRTVTSIVVDKFKGRYIVTAYSPTQQPDYVTQDDVKVLFQRMHKGNEMINGNLVALDAMTGASVWKHPVTVHQFQQLEGLPWDSPFLFLTRGNVYQGDKRKTKARIQMAMVDIESGKLKANELFSVPVRDSVFYQVTCRPQTRGNNRQSVELQIAALKATFQLDDVATAPQPVAALTNRCSYKRIQKEIAAPQMAAPLATDFENLTDQAIAAEKRRKELGQEEIRLTELEMQEQ